MNKTKISIVTPSYNQGQFIEEAILSVLNQGYDNFEHIIIDARSTDNTIDVLKKYPHLIWVSEPDEGQSDAINKGFKMATGDIIGWLNADDIYLLRCFEIVSLRLEDKNIDAVYGNYKFIDKEGFVTKIMKPIKPNRFITLFNCYIPSTTFFFKRKIIDNGIFIDKQFHISMDKEFFANIIFHDFKIFKLDYFMAYFRWHESNKSINNKKVKLTTAKEGLAILNRYAGMKIPITYFTAFLYRQTALSVNIFRKILSIIQ